MHLKCMEITRLTAEGKIMTLTQNGNKYIAMAAKLSTLLILVSINGQAEPLTEQQELEQQANTRIAEFSQALKGQLQAAIKQGGLIAAVPVCKSVAPTIAASNSKEGWTLSRTSLRVRNSNNAPDAWEIAQLQQLLQSNKLQICQWWSANM